MANAPDVLQLLRQARVLSGAELLARLRQFRPTLSRATMMRLIQQLGDQVVTRGAARRTSYAARRAIRGSGATMPLYRIGRDGRGEPIATLDPIDPLGCALRYTTPLEWPLADEMNDGWFPGLPYWLDDMRPQGFLGRNFAHLYADLLQVGDDPQLWAEDDVLHVLSVLGADSSGNYVLGEAAFRRHLETVQRGCAAIADARLAPAYAEQAAAAMAAGVAGSSAGGEFPKFTACRLLGGAKTHVIVKFSGNDGTPGVQRWSDLLVCEHLALETLAAQLPVAAARSRVHQLAGRTFLEVERFDRHGEFGRSPVCSWAALDAGLFGMAGSGWNKVAARLLADGYIDAATAERIVRLWHFGRLIANSDMHEGNLSFVPGPVPEGGQAKAVPLALAPAYDMLPMRYAPVRGVELPPRDYQPALPLPQERADWLPAAAAAIAFWHRAGADKRISAPFRAICRANAAALKRLADLA